jgi:hypothetical protein
VTTRQYTFAVTLAGAVAGAMVSYLFFTDRGREIRDQLLPMLDDLEHELGSIRGKVARTLNAANASWQAVNDALSPSHETADAPGPF